MTDVRKQVVTGVIPPQTDEALIRELFPSVAASPVAGLHRLGPFGWPILAIPYFAKVLPFLAKRYTLTNRRLMIRRGLRPKSVKEVLLAEIDDVRLKEGSYDRFYRAGTLEILSGGNVVLTLPAVPGPEAFRHAILSALKAWVPGKASGRPQPASEIKAK